MDYESTYASTFLGIFVLASALVFYAGLILDRTIPGPFWVLPGLGETVEFADSPIKFFYARYKRYGKTFRTYLFGKELVAVADREVLKVILSNEDDVAFILPIASANDIINPYNLSDFHRHKTFRRSILQALTPTNLKARLPLFNDIIEEHVSAWFKEGTLQLDAQLRRLVLHVAWKAVAGFDLDPIVREELTQLAMTVQGGLFAVPIDLPGTNLNKAKAAMPQYLSLLTTIIKARLELDPVSGGFVVHPPDHFSVPGSMDTTHALLNEFQDMGEVPTPELVAPRVLQNVIGASETTASTLLGVVLAIALTPGVMEKLRQEQAQVMAQFGLDLSYDVLQHRMPYLDATVKESTRVLPATHLLFREARRDINVAGYALKKGGICVIPLDLINCLDDEWDGDTTCQVPWHVDADRLHMSFRPERWLNEVQKPQQVYTFGFGPHSCVGMTLASLEVKMTLSMLLRQGTWQLLDKKPSIKFLPCLRLASGPANVCFTRSPLTAADS